jgi:hypothetical protein
LGFLEAEKDLIAEFAEKGRGEERRRLVGLKSAS